MNVLSNMTTLRGGKYRILRPLGHGSFGVTYLATAKFVVKGTLGEMETEVKVAVKEFFMGDINTRAADGSSVEGSGGSVFSNYRKKFRREAENLSKLNHPNIVKVLDVFDENNTTYYVMQYIEGMNLNDYIQKKGRLNEKEALRILSDIGKALMYMHENRMLHLDVKPKNVMIGNSGKAILIDFGLAKQYTIDGEPESSTTIGLGTPGYASIEQSDYHQEGTFPATLDVYALGATFYKMLTGNTPPYAFDIFNNGFPKDKLFNIGVSPKCADVVERAMNPQKSQRYQNVKEMLDDLNSSGYDVSNIKPDEMTIVDKVNTYKEQGMKHSSTCVRNDKCMDPKLNKQTYRMVMGSFIKNIFSFHGCASRVEFWLPVCTILPFIFIFMLMYNNIPIEIHDMIGYDNEAGEAMWNIIVGSVLWILVLSLLSVEVRRLRDAGHSVWWMLPPNLMFVSIIMEIHHNFNCFIFSPLLVCIFLFVLSLIFIYFCSQRTK